ncbi:DUF1186 domain-containing protein [Allochromatium palmeri]|uniref:DUF1186 domain-containing protein n=1 Tax=Allochromatium palmeri TaxID=231048 RepID=UPI001FE90DAF|nr:DUF1186 domain-containing protein [Allochromatium palmeri]
MNLNDIKDQLAFFSSRFPKAAIQAAITQREAVTPMLLEALEAMANAPEIPNREPYPMLHMYALYLLAQFREPAAYPLLVRLFSMPGDFALDLTGDIVTEDLDRMLVAVCGEDLDPIKAMIENPEVNEYVRSACLHALVTLVLQGDLAREEVIDYFRDLFHHKLEREPNFIWDALIINCCDLYPEELLTEIERVFADDLVDQFMIRLEDVQQVMADGKMNALREARQRRRGPIKDTVAEMSGWGCFNEDRHKHAGTAAKTAGGAQAKQQKVGRNDPCPCGSGKKYKKCCGG